MTATEQLIEVINEGHNVFLSGVGGCGKSYLLKQLYEYYSNPQHYRKVVLTSTTGISAYNIGGVTLHSFFKVVLPSTPPLDIMEFINKMIHRIRRNRVVLQRYLTTQLVLIDEISMCGSSMMDVLNYVCKQIRCNSKPFGGIQMILSGDMMQLPPVKDEYPFESASWEELNLKMFRLTKAWRFTHQSWVDLLHRARLGQLTTDDVHVLQSRVNCRADSAPVYLASKNDVVSGINTTGLASLSGPTTVYLASDFEIPFEEESIQPSKQVALPPEITSQFLADSALYLKEGAKVMLLANLNASEGLANGTRGTVTKLTPHVVTVAFPTTTVDISPYEFKIELGSSNKKYCRVAIPLKLAYATSIHKSQGLTLDQVEMDIGSDVFMDGQSYVALSRCKQLDGLFINKLDVSKIKPNYKALKFEQEFLKRCTEL